MQDVVMKVIKSVTLFGAVTAIGTIGVMLGMNERGLTMGGAAILLIGLRAIWKRQKTKRCESDVVIRSANTKDS